MPERTGTDEIRKEYLGKIPDDRWNVIVSHVTSVDDWDTLEPAEQAQRVRMAANVAIVMLGLSSGFTQEMRSYS